MRIRESELDKNYQTTDNNETPICISHLGVFAMLQWIEKKKNFRQTMGVKGGNLAVPTITKADNAEMKVEKTPHLSHGQRLYTALWPLSDGMEIQITIQLQNLC